MKTIPSSAIATMHARFSANPIETAADHGVACSCEIPLLRIRLVDGSCVTNQGACCVRVEVAAGQHLSAP